MRVSISLPILFLLLVSYMPYPTSGDDTSNEWIRTGTSAKYRPTKSLIITFENGTYLFFSHYAKTSFSWSVLSHQMDIIKLNVTMFASGPVEKWCQPCKKMTSISDLTYVRNITLEVNSKTREAFHNGSSIGRLYLWLPPRMEQGEEVDLTNVVATNRTIYAMKGSVQNVYFDESRHLKVYAINSTVVNPMTPMFNVYDWVTGLGLMVSMHGRQLIPQDYLDTHNVTFNDIRVRSYGSVPLAVILNLDWAGVMHLNLVETNIELGSSPIQLWDLLLSPLTLIGIPIIIVTSTTLVLLGKKRMARRRLSLLHNFSIRKKRYW